MSTESEPQETSRSGERVQRTVGQSRFSVILAIVGVLISSTVMLVYCLVALVKAVYTSFSEAHFDLEGVKHLALELIEMTDFFLLGMVLYVVGIGMYQLFIDQNVAVPSWMRVSSLDELKTQILNVVIVMLVVTFLGVALSTTAGSLEFLYYGLAISVVIVAVSVFNWVHHTSRRH